MNTNPEANNPLCAAVVVVGSTVKFNPGRMVATPGALAALAARGCAPHELLRRHLCGDWGDLGAEDAARNDQALLHDDRLLSAYDIGGDARIWVITEADRSVTTLLLPSEY